VVRGAGACTADHGQALVGIGLTRAMNAARAASVASSYAALMSSATSSSRSDRSGF